MGKVGSCHDFVLNFIPINLLYIIHTLFECQHQCTHAPWFKAELYKGFIISLAHFHQTIFFYISFYYLIIRWRKFRPFSRRSIPCIYVYNNTSSVQFILGHTKVSQSILMLLLCKSFESLNNL